MERRDKRRARSRGAGRAVKGDVGRVRISGRGATAGKGWADGGQGITGGAGQAVGEESRVIVIPGGAASHTKKLQNTYNVLAMMHKLGARYVKTMSYRFGL